MRHAQRGLSLSGFMVTAVIFLAAAMLAFKIVPPYLEYQTIQKAFRAMAADAALAKGGKGQVVSAFNSRATIDDIKAISADDLEIVQEDGRLSISAQYSVKVRLFSNLSACMDFAPSSDK